MAKTLTVYLAADLKKFSSGMNQAQQQVGGFSGSLKNVLGPALIAAGAAAGAFAAKLAVDGVKAAVEDEAAVAKLATTLKNLGFDDQLDPLEKWIAQVEVSAGVVDNDLRAAFERLVRSTGDVQEAQKALTIAVDISASKGKDLSMVADSLGKAYDGQVTSLQRLGLGLSNATILSRDMDAVTSELQTLFAGQAAAAAQTYQGQLDRLGIAFDNLQESFGTGFLNALGDTNSATDSFMDLLADLQPAIEKVGESIGTVVEALAGNEGLQDQVIESADNLGVLAEAFGNLVTVAGEAADATTEYADSLPGTSEYSGPIGQSNFLIDVLKLMNTWFRQNSEDANEFGSDLEDVSLGLDDARYDVLDFSEGLRQGSIAARDARLEISDLGDEAVDSAKQAVTAAGGWAAFWRAAVGASTLAREYAQGLSGTVVGAIVEGANIGPDVETIRRMNKFQASLVTVAETLDGPRGSSVSSGTQAAVDVSKKLVTAYEQQDQKVTATREALAQYTEDLNVLKEAAEAYADVIRGALGSALDLGAAYAGQFNKEGEATGVSLYEGFQQQVDQLEWFGNVLNALKAQGADASFIAAVAGEGAAVGGALGQQMLDDGMVPAMAESWVNVQNKIDELTAPLIPDFLQTGIALGGELVTGLGNRLEEEVKTLAKLGKNMGKPVGAAFKAQIAKDVAAAVRNVEAAATAARAEKVAQAEAAALRLTQQSVGDAFARIVADADKRNGRNVAPVLT